MRPVRLTCLVLMCVCIGCGAGCASRSPLERWQGIVEHQIQHEGHGDPTILRMLTRSATRPELILMRDGNGPKSSARGRRDVSGALLTHRKIGDRNWYVFFVSVLSRGGSNGGRAAIDESGLVAFSADRDELTWVVGKRSGMSAGQTAAASPVEGSPRMTESPGMNGSSRYLAEPLRLSVEGNLISVTGVLCGREWTLRLPESS